jgi:HPt (histidine-containing phosphotransfer) domain-containing protein
MNDHLAKPVEPDALLAAVQRWAPAAPAPRKKGFTPSPELAQRYAKQKAATLEALTCAVRYGAFSEKTVDDLAERLHKLAGTAAMFGDAQLGDHARTLETNLRTWDADERIRRLRAASEALRRVA